MLIVESSEKTAGNKNFWKDRRIFVTGATGFLGAWVVKFLIELGADVVCLVRDKVPMSNFYLMGLDKRVIVVKGDFNDFDVVDRALNEYEIDTVFHIGAQTIVGIANRNPMPTLRSNIIGTVNVLEACRKNPTVKRIIVASSDKAYGTSDKLPYDERTELRGEHPYDVSKSCTDLIARMYFKTYKLPVCITRCGNLYGPGDLNFNRIVPGVLRDLHSDRGPVIRSDGSFIRSYFYVKDAALAYIELAEKMEEKNLFGEAFNFSSEQKLSVLELTNKMIDVTGKNLKPIVLSQASNEIKEQYLSSEKAKIILGWNSKYEIDNGLRETATWYFNFLNNR
jgi:CDP-glucose 4,6-dehydratase